MFTQVTRHTTGLCTTCDAVVLADCRAREGTEDDVVIHARLPRLCRKCAPVAPHYPRASVYFSISADTYGRIAASLASASDKTFGTSVIARLAEEPDPILRAAHLRVVPEVLTHLMHPTAFRGWWCCCLEPELSSARRINVESGRRNGLVLAPRKPKETAGDGKPALPEPDAPQAPGGIVGACTPSAPPPPPSDAPGGGGAAKTDPTTADDTGRSLASGPTAASACATAAVPPSVGTTTKKKPDTISKEDDGKLPVTMCPARADFNDGTLKVEVVLDGKVTDTVATKVGPSCGKPVHYANEVNALRAAIETRVKGKQPVFKPSARVLERMRETVAALKELVFTKEAVKKWRDYAEDVGLGELVSKKWSVKTFEQAFKNLADAGVDVRVQYKMQIKSEVREFDEDKGCRPRIVNNCGPEAQICMKVVMSCLEHILFHHFKNQSIKHTPKIAAVKRIFAQFKEEDTVYEGDGSAWDYCISPGLKAVVENDIIWHVAELLFGTSDIVAGASYHWWKADMSQREKKKVTAPFTKGEAVARVVMANVRMSGDAGTSSLNWMENAVCWASILLEKPREWVADPNAKHYTGYMGKKIRFKAAYEGDDSVVATTSTFPQPSIEREWRKCGFNMKLAARAVGDRMVFVGMESMRLKQSFSHPIPEVKRGIVQSAWTLMKDPTPGAIGMSFAARAQMNQDCELMSRYYAALARGWFAQCGTEEIVIDRDNQFDLLGDFVEGRKCTAAKALDFTTTRKGDDALLLYMSKEDVAVAYRKMDAFDNGLDSSQSPTEIFPASMFC